MSERYHLQILDVQTTGVKLHGPLTESLAIELLARMFKDQPLGMVYTNQRVYILDLDTGEIKKPNLKLQI